MVIDPSIFCTKNGLMERNGMDHNQLPELRVGLQSVEILPAEGAVIAVEKDLVRTMVEIYGEYIDHVIEVNFGLVEKKQMHDIRHNLVRRALYVIKVLKV